MKRWIRGYLGSTWLPFTVFAGMLILLLWSDWFIVRRSLVQGVLILTGLSYFLIIPALVFQYRRRQWLAALLNLFYLLLGALLVFCFGLVG